MPQGLCGGHLLYCAAIAMLCYKAKAQEGVTSKHLHYEHVQFLSPHILEEQTSPLHIFEVITY